MSRDALEVVRRHPFATMMGALIMTTTVGHASVRHDAGRALLYLAAIFASVIVIEWVLRARGVTPAPTPVRQPAVEVAICAACYAVAMIWLYQRFVLQTQPQGLLRLVWVLLGLGSVFNVIIAGVLLARRYRLTELGLRSRGWVAVPPVIVIFGSLALLAAPSHVTWREIVEDTGGSPLEIASLALSAAVPEEFFRFVWQTRVAAWCRNPATGWFVASILWAALHAPHDYVQTPSVFETTMGVIDKVPLGFLWGYLTARTGSFVPSLLLHATNVWGLQNLG